MKPKGARSDTFRRPSRFIVASRMCSVPKASPVAFTKSVSWLS
jgi:hypothetical protein